MAPFSVGFAVNALARKTRCITEADGWHRFWVSSGAGAVRMRSERTTTGLTSRTDSGGQTLDDKDWMGFGVVIRAVAGTDGFSFVARKHRCNVEFEEEKKVGLAECLAQQVWASHARKR